MKQRFLGSCGWFLLASLFSAFALWPGAGQASCVYNKADHPIRAMCWFTNGSPDWIISFGNHKCWNGEGGKVEVAILDSDDNTWISYSCKVKVDTHGWVSVYPEDGGKWRVTSKHSDGSHRETCHCEKKR